MKSLVTATWNRSEQLKRGILTVINQTETVNEIVVVDDGSTDDTKDVCEFLEKKAQEKEIDFIYVYLDHKEARISSIPKNIGFEHTKGDIVFFTESELLHVTDTIKQATDTIKQGKTPLATQIWTMGDRIYKSLPDYFYSQPQLILGHEYAMLVSGNMQNTKAPDSDWGITGSINCYAGCFWGVKRDWFIDIGGFDEEMEGHGFEDWDILHRLDLYGKPVEQRNDIIIIHQWHTKNYPYNIYNMAEKNGKISEDRIKRGEYRANIGKQWGKI